MVGMQTDAQEWFSAAKEFETPQPGYVEFLNAAKGHCFRGRKFMDVFQSWKDHDKTLPTELSA
jgi:hypothetical protein